MTLLAHIEYVRDRQKTLEVFNPAPDSTIVADLKDYFATQNVAIRSKQTSVGEPDSVAVLKRDGKVLASMPTTKLESLLAGGGLQESGLGIDDTEYHEILRHLKETTFTSHNRSQMVTVSHEIENRASRVTGGRLYAGFQQPAKLNAQATRYERLAEQSLDIHTFASPGAPVDVEGITHHALQADEIERSWFVVFNGGGDDMYKTALLATEEAPNQFYGFWSDDPELVDSICQHLNTAYLTAKPDEQI
ncbi:DICT sensory domain-containing protein [Halonotius sp. GCM10025705]|uniref:DICT sensory domain-containing protein n=1 Tax=Halonotius sp. GCM10025705 TaxID=3252678 RepID=UPI003623A562